LANERRRDGIVGMPGAPGKIGNAGKRGEDGKVGVDGAIGAVGPQGLPGPIGPQGMPGPAGAAGIPGSDVSRDSHMGHVVGMVTPAPLAGALACESALRAAGPVPCRPDWVAHRCERV
jgi:hypothetical protein